MQKLSTNTFDDKTFPEALRKEIETILRNEWPVNQNDKEKSRDWDVTHHIVLSIDNQVVSYSAIARKNLTHQGTEYDVVGLSGVITHPKERGKGYGRQVITIATDIIKNSSADLALFNTAQIGLYEKFGYEKLPLAKILKGNPDNPEVYPEDVFALFLSEKAKHHRKDFETIPIYFGQRVW
jgi:predicted acetyltransferase